MKIEDSIPLLNLSEIRLECLNRAVQTHGQQNPERIIEVAEKYYQFIMGQEDVEEYPLHTAIEPKK